MRSLSQSILALERIKGKAPNCSTERFYLPTLAVNESGVVHLCTSSNEYSLRKPFSDDGSSAASE